MRVFISLYILKVFILRTHLTYHPNINLLIEMGLIQSKVCVYISSNVAYILICCNTDKSDFLVGDKNLEGNTETKPSTLNFLKMYHLQT